MQLNQSPMDSIPT